MKTARATELVITLIVCVFGRVWVGEGVCECMFVEFVAILKNRGRNALSPAVSTFFDDLLSTSL